MTTRSACGGCLCGNIRYRVTAAPVWSGYCHCRSCRSFTGSVVTSWLGLNPEDLEFTDGKPAIYESAGVRRGYCADCGSSLTYAADRFPGYLQLHIGSLDQADRFRPEAHVHCAEKIGWFEIDDDLPRFDHSITDETDDWKRL